MAIQTVKFAPHPLAEIFPRPTAEEQRELTDDIRRHGLQEPIVLFQGKVLDGISRQIGCAVAEREPRYAEFMHLHRDVKEAGPLAYVIGRNLKRRHLTPSQRAMIATELIPAMERELRVQRNGEQEADLADAPKRGRGRPPKIVSTLKAAAAALGVSPRSVGRAKKLKREKPEKAEEIKQGKVTLGGAEKKGAVAERRAKDRADALARVRQVCGDEFADAVERGGRLKNHADLLEFAAQHKPEMVAQQGLIELGWSLRKAQMFKSKVLTKNHTIMDLMNKAASSGMSLSIAIDGWRIEINREKK
jgi:hypothetical protein